jgi:hypothetical protein
MPATSPAYSILLDAIILIILSAACNLRSSSLCSLLSWIQIFSSAAVYPPGANFIYWLCGPGRIATERKELFPRLRHLRRNYIAENRDLPWLRWLDPACAPLSLGLSFGRLRVRFLVVFFGLGSKWCVLGEKQDE